MRFSRHLPLFLLLIPALFSCNKDLNVNADWQDITVVYGLLDQSADTTFIKITKAYLGPGNAMQFAKIPDSSNYPDKLEVRLDVYNGSDSVTSHFCDTITIHNKKAGDSVFYYPDQLMYYTKAVLLQNLTYKLVIRNRQTGKLVKGETFLVHDFEILKPQVSVGFIPDQSFEVKWNPGKNGKRYQLAVRFYYLEWLKSAPEVKQMKYLDWVVTSSILAVDETSTQPFDQWFAGDGFYSAVHSQIDTSSFIGRYASHCEFIFSVATRDLNTYLEVTEPSMGIVQEKPSYTNIENGIGLFAARFTNKTDSIWLSPQTKSQLQKNPLTINRGF